jgi:hypothetical protein
LVPLLKVPHNISGAQNLARYPAIENIFSKYTIFTVFYPANRASN